MALSPIKLPSLQARIPIVDARGQPTSAFVRYWNIDFIGSIENSVNGIIEVQNELAETQAELALVQQKQAEEIERLNAVVFANQQTTSAAQAAQQAANDAQSTADEALANGTVSGAASDPTIFLSGTGWVPCSVVNLNSVLAGTLKITGSGPQQDLDVTLSSNGFFYGEFRVVEIVGGIDTVVAGPFAFSAYQGMGDSAATVSNDDIGTINAFSAARSTTGAVDYRIDARRVSGPDLNDVFFYLYVRRSP